MSIVYIAKLLRVVSYSRVIVTFFQATKARYKEVLILAILD